jgi:hypothetical protein
MALCGTQIQFNNQDDLEKAPRILQRGDVMVQGYRPCVLSRTQAKDNVAVHKNSSTHFVLYLLSNHIWEEIGRQHCGKHIGAVLLPKHRRVDCPKHNQGAADGPAVLSFEHEGTRELYEHAAAGQAMRGGSSQEFQ